LAVCGGQALPGAGYDLGSVRVAHPQQRAGRPPM